MPRLLQRNQRAIAGTVDAEQRARLLAQRALLLARHWRVGELPDALAHAEAAVAACADRRALAELELARGVAMYYGADVAQAALPLRRGRDEARAAGDAGVEAECEAWLGCIGATLQHEPVQVLGHLQRAVALGESARPLAAARAQYVAATLCQEAGLIDAATALYRRASRLAREQHDEQLLAAILRYMTLAQVQQARRAQAAGTLDDELRRQALAALGSAQQLALALTDDEQCLQFGLRLGEMHRVGGDHAAALAAFEPHLDAAEQRGMTWEAAIARADQAVCLLHAGRPADALSAAQRARAGLAGVHDAYSRALIHASLAEVARAASAADAAVLEAESQRCWALDRAYCERLQAALLLHKAILV
jgi:tetratricopeptide (TPR) repeat protein